MEKLFMILLVCLIFSRTDAEESACKKITAATGYDSCKGKATGSTVEPNCCYEEDGDEKYCDSYSDEEKNDLATYVKNYNSNQTDENEKIVKVICGDDKTYENQCKLVSDPEGYASCQSKATDDTTQPNCCYEENGEENYCDSYSDDEKNDLASYVKSYNSNQTDDVLKIVKVNCGDSKTYENQCKSASDPTGYDSCKSKATDDTTQPNCCYEENGEEKYCDSYSDTEKNDLATYVKGYNSKQTDEDEKIIKVDCGDGKTYDGSKYLNARVFALIALIFTLF